EPSPSSGWDDDGYARTIAQRPTQLPPATVGEDVLDPDATTSPPRHCLKCLLVAVGRPPHRGEPRGEDSWDSLDADRRIGQLQQRLVGALRLGAVRECSARGRRSQRDHGADVVALKE